MRREGGREGGMHIMWSGYKEGEGGGKGIMEDLNRRGREGREESRGVGVKRGGMEGGTHVCGVLWYIAGGILLADVWAMRLM